MENKEIFNLTVDNNAKLILLYINTYKLSNFSKINLNKSLGIGRDSFNKSWNQLKTNKIIYLNNNNKWSTDLSTTDLSTTDLSTTDLSTTDLSTTDLSTTDLSTTDLSTTYEDDDENDIEFEVGDDIEEKIKLFLKSRYINLDKPELIIAIRKQFKNDEVNYLFNYIHNHIKEINLDTFQQTSFKWAKRDIFDNKLIEL